MIRAGTTVVTNRLALRVVTVVLSAGLLLPAWLHAQPAPKPSRSSATAASRKPAANQITAVRAPTTESGPCQIGVIPIAGNLFTIKKDGLIALADRRARISVDGWALDDLLVSRVRAAAPGLSVRRIPFTREELQLAGRRKPEPLFYNRAEDIKEFTKVLAQRINCERYVVIHRDGGTVGFGIGMTGGSPTARAAILFALMSIRVYDGRSFELIKEAPARVISNSVIDRAFHNSLGEPFRLVDTAAFPEKPADAATNPVLRDGVRSLLTESLDQTLPGLLQRTAQTPTR